MRVEYSSREKPVAVRPARPVLIGGNLYQRVDAHQTPDTAGTPFLYMYCAYNNTLVSIRDGGVWSASKFGDGKDSDSRDWYDVTEQYILTRSNKETT